MRVISGKARGLKLNAPKNDDVRPTTDRVKESLFNMINSYMMDSNILDLFAGTGSLALKKEKFDVIFMDPPYYKNMFSDALLAVDNNELLKEDGIIVVEHDTVDKFPDNMGRLYKSREKKYGNTTITFYKVEE